MYHVGKSHFHSDCLVYQNELIVRKAWHLYQDATIERQPRASEWVIARPSDRASERSSERATERPSDRATERLKINIARIPELRCRVWGKQNINFMWKKSAHKYLLQNVLLYPLYRWRNTRTHWTSGASSLNFQLRKLISIANNLVAHNFSTTQLATMFKNWDLLNNKSSRQLACMRSWATSCGSHCCRLTHIHKHCETQCAM